MKITFVGSFDEKDVREFAKEVFLIKIFPFIESDLEKQVYFWKPIGKSFSAKITFNTDLKPIKIIFRKDKKEKQWNETKNG